MIYYLSMILGEKQLANVTLSFATSLDAKATYIALFPLPQLRMG